MAGESVVLDKVGCVTDEELIARLKHLVGVDQRLTARLLLHLGEVDARGLYREYACASMFAYCVEELQMSEAQTFLRIQVARLGREFPRVLELLAQGALHLSGIKLLGPHLTAENHVQLLERARGKRKREIELLVATIAPKPDVPSRMRKLPVRSGPQAGTREVQTAQTSVALRQALSAHEATLEMVAKQPSLLAPGTMRAALSVSDPNRPVCPAGSTAIPLDERRAPLDCAGKSESAARASRGPATANRDASHGLVDGAGKSESAARAGSGPATANRDASPGLVDGASASESVARPDSRTVTSSVDSRDGQFECARESHRASFALEAPRARGSSKPLRPGRYKVEFTAGQELHDKLLQLQELLRHQVPDGDLAVIVERAVDVLIDTTMKQRFAQTRAAREDLRATQGAKKQHSAQTDAKPQSEPRTGRSRYVPRAVVREVYQRDAGQCTFVSAEGKRCSERGFLELHHHERPYARGGEATVENLRLVCRAHNALFAERDYGPSLMRSKLRQGRARRDELVPELVPI